MKSKRQAIQEKRRRQRIITRLVWIGAGLIALVLIAYLVWLGVRPAYGESVPVMEDTGHIEDGTQPPPYNSDPPTSGPHYAGELNAGFIHEEDLVTLPQFPVGYLVHNLEHGYVIFWYNCNLLSVQECSELKTQIQSVMTDYDNFKLIAFPWETIDVPVVMTSWGQMLPLENFDPDAARKFIERNRNRAPEPNAP